MPSKCKSKSPKAPNPTAKGMKIIRKTASPKTANYLKKHGGGEFVIHPKRGAQKNLPTYVLKQPKKKK